jgi:hypothetical protein
MRSHHHREFYGCLLLFIHPQSEHCTYISTV